MTLTLATGTPVTTHPRKHPPVDSDPLRGVRAQDPYQQICPVSLTRSPVMLMMPRPHNQCQAKKIEEGEKDTTRGEGD